MTRAGDWRPQPRRLTLSGDAIHVWRTRLHLDPRVVTGYEALLSPAERQRVRRFRVAVKRREYVVTRGLLRRLLGELLDADPRALELAYGAHGKPYLSGAQRGRAAFNVSHSHELALIGVTAGRELGIDVEKIRPRVQYRKLARRFFSPLEVEMLMRLPAALQQASFFTCWARKEAVIKGIGRGIGLGLDRFDVSLAPDAPPALLATRWDPAEAARWTLVQLDVGPGYAGALAVEGTGFEVCCWESP